MLKKQKKLNNSSSAFTLIEILVVIIVIGLLAATLSFNFAPDKLQIAADQLIKDIRFTQSLALKDDKYQPFPKSTSAVDQNQSKYWFKQWWQLRIGRTTNGDYFYEIFSDLPHYCNSCIDKGKYNFEKTAHYPDGDVNWKKSIALEPLTHKLMIGNCGASHYPDCNQTNKDLNLTKMGILIIKDDNNNTLTSGSIRFVFDNVGNVYLDEGASGDAGDINPFDANRYLLTHNYKLKLCSDNNCNKCIAIEISPTGNIEQVVCN